MKTLSKTLHKIQKNREDNLSLTAEDKIRMVQNILTNKSIVSEFALKDAMKEKDNILLNFYIGQTFALNDVLTALSMLNLLDDEYARRKKEEKEELQKAS